MARPPGAEGVACLSIAGRDCQQSMQVMGDGVLQPERILLTRIPVSRVVSNSIQP